MGDETFEGSIKTHIQYIKENMGSLKNSIEDLNNSLSDLKSKEIKEIKDNLNQIAVNKWVLRGLVFWNTVITGVLVKLVFGGR